MPRVGPIRAVLAVAIALLLVYLFSHRSFVTNAPEPDPSRDFLPSWPDLVPPSYYIPSSNPTEANLTATRNQRANATLFMLARNTDVQAAVDSVRRLEDRFNIRHHYPWTFLNDEPFSEEFKTRVALVASGKVQFGTIPAMHWQQPSWINETKATEGRNKLEAIGKVPYAGSISYRNMCRFNSGFVFQHELMLSYKWYWRVEPDVDFTCDIQFDPFHYMEENDKVYGWTVTLTEFGETIPTLWNVTRAFMDTHPQYVAEDNAIEMIIGIDRSNFDYNGCHFWSNFEIASLDFFRSPAYTDYFTLLESTGGFYYERWGDAPVHSLAAALFLPKSQLHFFEDIGYEHRPINHCPPLHKGWAENRCQCDWSNTFDYDGSDQCRWRWDLLEVE